MEEKDIALMLLDLAKDRIEEVKDYIEKIKDINEDFVWYADMYELENFYEKLDEIFYNIKKGIRRG